MLAGCAVARPMNPAFAVTVDEARTDLERMEREPVRLDRPVIVLGGWGDPGIAAHGITSQLERVTSADDRERIMGVSFPLSFTFDAAADRLIEQVRDRFPGPDAGQTVEVDVVAFSMGGLVARHAATSRVDGEGEPLPRLTIHRLYTISTPHRGAALAGPLMPDPRVGDMRAGSAFLTRLDEARGGVRDGARREETYPIIAYVRLDDPVVGSANAAPAGQGEGEGGGVYWVGSQPFTLWHTGAAGDPRILADIARRVRGEPPLTADQPAPLPVVPTHRGARFTRRWR